MSITKRAFLYVTRKKGKTFLLFAILLIMATFVLTGLSIRKASESAQLDLRQSLGGRFDIFVDWDNSPYVVKETIRENYDEETGKSSNSFLMYSTVQFTPEDIAAIKSVPGVKYCSARLEDLVPFEELSLFPGTIQTAEQFRGRTKIMAVCNSEDDRLFTSGTFTLTDGRHIRPADKGVAIISQDLADKSGLKIGDTITTHSYSTKDEDYTGKEIGAQIIGLFTPSSVEQFGETVTAYDKIQNRVFTDLQTGIDVDGGGINYGFSAINVAIDDPQNMAQVVSDVRALPDIDWTAFTTEADNEAYKNAAAPLATLNELVVTLLAVIIAVSAIILALILTLWTKTRIHEIGVFLSVGIKKPAIVGQYLIEVLLVAVLAFGMSYFTSSAVAGQIGSHLLEQSMQAENEDGDYVAAASAEVGAEELLRPDLPTENGMEVSVGLTGLALLCLIGAAVIVIAVSVSSVTVMRLKPREILSKMS